MEPKWRIEAVALERENKLEEAEKVISTAVQDLYFALEIATLYRDRYRRLTQEGDAAGAEAARKKAVDWAYFLASQATSGGEGMALSAERDRFLRTLS